MISLQKVKWEMCTEWNGLLRLWNFEVGIMHFQTHCEIFLARFTSVFCCKAFITQFRGNCFQNWQMLPREEVGGSGKFEGEVAASKVAKLLVLIKKTCRVKCMWRIKSFLKYSKHALYCFLFKKVQKFVRWCIRVRILLEVIVSMLMIVPPSHHHRHHHHHHHHHHHQQQQQQQQQHNKTSMI